MKIIDRLLGKYQTQTKEIEEIEGKEDIVFSTPFDNWYPVSGSEKPTIGEMEAAYKTSSVVRACVDEIVEAVKNAELEAPPLIEDVLRNPSSRIGFPRFIGQITTRLLLTGRAYVWKRKRGNAIEELWSFPTSQVLPVVGYTIDKPVKEYRILNEKSHWTVQPEDMVVISYDDPQRFDGFTSKLESCWDEVKLDSELTTMQKNILRNLAVAGVVAENDREITPGQKRQLKDNIEGSIARLKQGGVLVLPRGTKISSAMNFDDFDMHGLSSNIESRISAAFNVPAILVGLRAGLDRSTYSNYSEARDSFYDETIDPILNDLSDELTIGLLKDEGQEGEIILRIPEPEMTPEKAVEDIINREAQERVEGIGEDEQLRGSTNATD